LGVIPVNHSSGLAGVFLKLGSEDTEQTQGGA
jgi:hypothetical protein